MTNKKYPVQLDSDMAFVNVPWTDTDTVYTLPAATNTALGGFKTGYSQQGQSDYPVLLSDDRAYVNITLPTPPTTLPNPQSLALNVNSTPLTSYDGSSGVSWDITIPTALASPGTLTFDNGVNINPSTDTYDGSSNVTIKLPAGLRIDSSPVTALCSSTTSQIVTVSNTGGTNGEVRLVGYGSNTTTGTLMQGFYLCELPIASSNRHGTIRVGSGLSIDANTGVLSASAGGSYTLPSATDSVLGGVKIGDSMTISSGDVLDYKYSKPYATVITNLNDIGNLLYTNNIFYANISANSTLAVSSNLLVKDWDYVLVIHNTGESTITISLGNVTGSGPGRYNLFSPDTSFTIDSNNEVELSWRFSSVTNRAILVWSPELASTGYIWGANFS